MQTFPNAATAAANSSPVSPLGELAAVIATVSELTLQARHLSRTAQALQASLPDLLARFEAEAAARAPPDEPPTSLLASYQVFWPMLNVYALLLDVWVVATAKTHTQVAANHANAADGQRNWWVVFVGREPGIYATVDEANAQVLGVPSQQYRRHKSKREALDFYSAKHEAGDVNKLVKLP
ncbi:hypothetical protein K438DRAFT_1983095 [Mycena galopus ATCC 62051]|nr:hypothetical protein K438DRAFT_1983095 [Mycena galopus ATCC 62051]